MAYKFIWYNLPAQIKKLIEPFKEELTAKANKVMPYNLPYTLELIIKELSVIYPECVTEQKVYWRTIRPSVEKLAEVIDCINEQE